MRILVVVHLFPPKNSAGTEVYTQNLALELQRRGNDVFVYHTERDDSRDQYEVSRRDNRGLPTICVVHNHRFPTFRHTYRDEKMEEQFGAVLDEVRPDVVHCQHLNLHSIGYLSILAERGIPVVYTLAEYLLLCPRNGWLLKHDMTRCAGPTPEDCALCTLTWPSPRESAMPKRLHRILGKARQRIGLSRSDYREAVTRRLEEVRAELAHVDLFIAPSRYLRGRFLEHGMVTEDRIVHSDYGFRLEDYGPQVEADRSGGENLRIGFIGAISEWKGVHVLVDAVNGLPDTVRCEIHGDVSSFPGYIEKLKSRNRHPGLEFMGRYDNSRIGEVLARFDVLVVPSLWYENSPLTIHEAFVFGVPVITGNEGGMAELVTDGENGLHFRIGDADDLREKLLSLIREPERLKRLESNIPSIKDIKDDARAMEDHFRELVSGKRTEP